jgi:hypothetical protein
MKVAKFAPNPLLIGNSEEGSEASRPIDQETLFIRHVTENVTWEKRDIRRLLAAPSLSQLSRSRQEVRQGTLQMFPSDRFLLFRLGPHHPPGSRCFVGESSHLKQIGGIDGCFFLKNWHLAAASSENGTHPLEPSNQLRVSVGMEIFEVQVRAERIGGVSTRLAELRQ